MDRHLPVVLREASGVIAVSKPAGLATQAPPGIPSVESWLRERLAGAVAGGYLGVPHRLDRAVTGVLLFAVTPRAARKLSRQFERRQIRKTYLAVVACADPAAAAAALRGDAEEGHGGPHAHAADEGQATRLAAGVVWRDVLAKVPDEPRARIVPAGTPGGREAVTIAALCRQVAADRLLVTLEPVTGRMHQLRLQAASRGLPVVGDTLYGGDLAAWRDRPPPELSDGAGSPDPRTTAIALHAWRIAYTDPDSGGPVVIEEPPPADWPAGSV